MLSTHIGVDCFHAPNVSDCEQMLLPLINKGRFNLVKLKTNLFFVDNKKQKSNKMHDSLLQRFLLIISYDFFSKKTNK